MAPCAGARPGSTPCVVNPRSTAACIDCATTNKSFAHFAGTEQTRIRWRAGGRESAWRYERHTASNSSAVPYGYGTRLHGGVGGGLFLGQHRTVPGGEIHARRDGLLPRALRARKRTAFPSCVIERSTTRRKSCAPARRRIGWRPSSGKRPFGFHAGHARRQRRAVASFGGKSGKTGDDRLVAWHARGRERRRPPYSSACTRAVIGNAPFAAEIVHEAQRRTLRTRRRTTTRPRTDSVQLERAYGTAGIPTFREASDRRALTAARSASPRGTHRWPSNYRCRTRVCAARGSCDSMQPRIGRF